LDCDKSLKSVDALMRRISLDRKGTLIPVIADYRILLVREPIEGCIVNPRVLYKFELIAQVGIDRNETNAYFPFRLACAGSEREIRVFASPTDYPVTIGYV
jgi:hypothetical protein